MRAPKKAPPVDINGWKGFTEAEVDKIVREFSLYGHPVTKTFMEQIGPFLTNELNCLLVKRVSERIPTLREEVTEWIADVRDMDRVKFALFTIRFLAIIGMACWFALGMYRLWTSNCVHLPAAPF